MEKLVIKKIPFDTSYLLHFMNTKFYKHQIKRTSAGTGVIHTSTKRILECHIPLPKIPEQQKIASILSNVDSKIKKQQEYKSKL